MPTATPPGKERSSATGRVGAGGLAGWGWWLQLARPAAPTWGAAAVRMRIRGTACRLYTVYGAKAPQFRVCSNG